MPSVRNASRLGDLHICGIHPPNLIAAVFQTTVWTENMLQARESDLCACGAKIVAGSPTVYVVNHQAARILDPTDHAGVLWMPPIAVRTHICNGGSGGAGVGAAPVALSSNAVPAAKTAKSQGRGTYRPTAAPPGSKPVPTRSPADCPQCLENAKKNGAGIAKATSACRNVQKTLDRIGPEGRAAVQAASKKYGISESEILAIMTQESNGRTAAESPCGASGLMQIMPATARGLGYSGTDAEIKEQLKNDPARNIMAGTRYLAQLRDGSYGRFHGQPGRPLTDPNLRAAAYNAGPFRESIQQGRTPNIRETQNYVAKTGSNRNCPDVTV